MIEGYHFSRAELLVHFSKVDLQSLITATDDDYRSIISQSKYATGHLSTPTRTGAYQRKPRHPLADKLHTVFADMNLLTARRLRDTLSFLRHEHKRATEAGLSPKEKRAAYMRQYYKRKKLEKKRGIHWLRIPADSYLQIYEYLNDSGRPELAEMLLRARTSGENSRHRSITWAARKVKDASDATNGLVPARDDDVVSR